MSERPLERRRWGIDKTHADEVLERAVPKAREFRAKYDRLEAINPDLLAALKEQGGDPTGTWHLWSCPAGRNDMPVKPCLGECVRARAAIKKAEEKR